MLYLDSRQTVGSHNAGEESSQWETGGQGGWQAPSHIRADKPAPAYSDLEDKSERWVPLVCWSVQTPRSEPQLTQGIPHLTTLPK